MTAFDLDDIEAAFRRYWWTGIVREDWDAWCDLFTDDVLYLERVLGTKRGREAVRRWIKPLMAEYGEIYGVYEWHHTDASGRVVVYMQNRRDRPGGGAPLDFPGVTILHYAGDGRWRQQEDYWATNLGKAQFEEYEALQRAHDPAHRSKRTRLDWGGGPGWTRGGHDYAARPAHHAPPA